MNSYVEDPLMPHLLDISSDPASKGLILAGGFGMRLKQVYLQEVSLKTLISPFPEGRATLDLDFFLRMELFVQPDLGAAVKEMLVKLNYIYKDPQWQFEKTMELNGKEERTIVDLLARQPRPEENVKYDERRVKARVKTGIHGRITPEAFAIDDMPQKIRICGDRTDKSKVEADVLVAHPFAYINMKIKAAHDWLQYKRSEQEGTEKKEKHVLDVYALVAMMTNEEIDEAKGLANKYADNPMAVANKQYVQDLYFPFESEGYLSIHRRLGVNEEDYYTFYEALQEALDIPAT